MIYWNSAIHENEKTVDQADAKKRADFF